MFKVSERDRGSERKRERERVRERERDRERAKERKKERERENKKAIKTKHTFHEVRGGYTVITLIDSLHSSWPGRRRGEL